MEMNRINNGKRRTLFADVGRFDFIDIPQEYVGYGLMSFSDEHNFQSFMMLENPSHVNQYMVWSAVGDGLVCLLQDHEDILTLWNPARRQHKIVQGSHNYMFFDDNDDWLPFLACGMDPMSKEYKVLFFLVRCGLYNVSQNEWRLFNDDDLALYRSFSFVNNAKGSACVNGVCYWTGVRKGAERSGRLLTFNLTTETFSILGSAIPVETLSDGILHPTYDGRICIWDTQIYAAGSRERPCKV